jgi:hypothetical protein
MHMDESTLSPDWLGILIVVVLLSAAVPYVARMRHPEQKPLAAYLIFLFAFIAGVAVLFNLLAWLAEFFGLGSLLDQPLITVLFLLLILLPPLVLATWLVRLPPRRQAPPD